MSGNMLVMLVLAAHHTTSAVLEAAVHPMQIQHEREL
jgi:hypothetical protein